MGTIYGDNITDLEDKVKELQARIASLLDDLLEKNKKISDLQTELRTTKDEIRDGFVKWLEDG